MSNDVSRATTVIGSHSPATTLISSHTPATTVTGSPPPSLLKEAMSTDIMRLYQRDDTEDKTIIFDGIAALFRAFDEMRGIDFIIVNNVSQAAFERIDRQREIRRRKFRFFFQAEKQQLHVTLPNPPHELMHRIMYDEIRDDIRRPPSMPRFVPCGSITYNHPNGSSSKEGDSGGYPGRDGASDDTNDDVQWPSLVIECGLSQSLASLHAAMRWWFAASEHRIKVVLVIKLYRSTHTATIEKFTEEAVAVAVHRPGATTTRSVSAPTRLQPVLQQTITIAPVPNSSPARFRVTRGALVIEFALLYRRAPGPGPDERDVVISEARLEELAREVWRW